MANTPTFDIWTVIFLIAAAQGFFIAFVLWKWRKGSRQANRLLAALVALFSVSMVEYVLYWTRYMYQFPSLTDISVNFTFLYSSLIWLYLRTLFEGTPLKWSDSWHLFPPFLASIPFISWYMLPSAEKSKLLVEGAGLSANFWGIRLQFWGRMVYMTVFALWNSWYVWKQPHTGDTARWARLIVVFQVVFGLAYASYFILIRFAFFNVLWDYHISAVMTAMIYAIAYAGYVQPTVFNGLSIAEATAGEKYRNSGLTREAGRSLLDHLEKLMVQERPYHDPEFNLEKLAGKMDASKHHVSQVINEILGMSFFEYINYLRVKDACSLLAETTRQDMHVIEVAYAVGFNNKMSFNAAFKRATGMTPTQYREHHSKSDSSFQPEQAS